MYQAKRSAALAVEEGVNVKRRIATPAVVKAKAGHQGDGNSDGFEDQAA